MMPFLPLARRVAAPYLFLLAVGGIMALAEIWLRCQLPRRPAMNRTPATTADVPRAVVARRGRARRVASRRAA